MMIQRLHFTHLTASCLVAELIFLNWKSLQNDWYFMLSQQSKSEHQLNSM